MLNSQPMTRLSDFSSYFAFKKEWQVSMEFSPCVPYRKCSQPNFTVNCNFSFTILHLKARHLPSQLFSFFILLLILSKINWPPKVQWIGIYWMERKFRSRYLVLCRFWCLATPAPSWPRLICFLHSHVKPRWGKSRCPVLVNVVWTRVFAALYHCYLPTTRFDRVTHESRES